jgi:hypothetical protein
MRIIQFILDIKKYDTIQKLLQSKTWHERHIESLNYGQRLADLPYYRNGENEKQ